jgi:8-oxo-dGTP diphosphatase
MPVPQFGSPGLVGPYPDRPAAFSVILHNGKIATVEILHPTHGRVYDLPGGGIDPGETPRDAAIRECAEEAGMVVGLESEPFVFADHLNFLAGGAAHNTRGAFYSGWLIRVDPLLHVEADHTLVWLEPDAALRKLVRDSHAWAVATWLRLRARAGAGSERP